MNLFKLLHSLLNPATEGDRLISLHSEKEEDYAKTLEALKPVRVRALSKMRVLDEQAVPIFSQERFITVSQEEMKFAAKLGFFTIYGLRLIREEVVTA